MSVRILFWTVPLIGISLILAALMQNSPNPSQATAHRAVPGIPVAKCINLGNALEAPKEGEWGYFIGDEDLVAIRNAGFDTVRMPVNWAAHTGMEPPYRIDPNLFDRVDHVIRVALSAGLNVIVNVHHYNELMVDPDRHEPRLEAIWDQLSTHYAHWPDGVMFELINEPHTALTAARVDALNVRLLGRVRLDNPGRWIIVTGTDWSNLVPLTRSDPPRDPRVITTFHHYGPFEFTHQGASWTTKEYPVGVTFGNERDVADIQEVMRRAAEFRKQTGLPILLGEFGAIEKAALADRTEWTRTMREAAQAEGIGWCYWDFTTNFGIYDRAKEAWIGPLLDALMD